MDMDINLRNYVDSERQDIVERNYALNHEHMTYELVMNKRYKWLQFKQGEYSIKEVLDMVDTLVDDSDPDVSVGNSIHAFQTAERLRADFPDEDWTHLTGLIHDLGKVLSVWGEPQHLVVGDTYVVGCEHPSCIVFHKYFENNSDTKISLYKTKYGIYKPECGLKNLTMSWGHDEYLYHVLLKNNSKLPSLCHKIIRYHSFYAWHKDQAYGHLVSGSDNKKLLPMVRKFSTYDLYSKTDEVPDCEHLWKTYYEPLCKKYGLDGKLKW
tara:strand:+ start:262 stop:1062 length:801 start_codon:yes stop_codon:yes gene_type:complete